MAKVYHNVPDEQKTEKGPDFVRFAVGESFVGLVKDCQIGRFTQFGRRDFVIVADPAGKLGTIVWKKRLPMPGPGSQIRLTRTEEKEYTLEIADSQEEYAGWVSGNGREEE